MFRVLTAAQVRAAEMAATESGDVTLFDLMERAGTRLAAEAMGHPAVSAQKTTAPKTAQPGSFPPEAVVSGSSASITTAPGSMAAKVAVLTGPGNNGSDGWVAARVLHEAGCTVKVLSMCEPTDLRGEAARAARSAIETGVEWEAPTTTPGQDELASATLIIDALLGTGSRLPLGERFAAWCLAASAAAASGAAVYAADLPTGVASDSGMVDGHALKAEKTVTFAVAKPGLVTYPAAEYAGEVVVADIGIGQEADRFKSASQVWEPQDFAAIFPRQVSTAHKNSHGRVLVLAGSVRFPGAAVLAARGAQRAGAGYVTLAVPDPVVPIAQGHLVSAPVVGLASSDGAFAADAAAAALGLAGSYDAVVLGPGLTLACGAVHFTREVYAHCTCPLVVDADALGALADALVGDPGALAERTGQTVLTPHPGELARLLAQSVTEAQADRVSSSARLAAKGRAVLLKGAGTVVSEAERSVIITSACPALATAGTGDVLAGVVGALLGAGLEPFEAAVLGAHLHGLAGEIAADRIGPVGIIAEDIPDALPSAVGRILGHGSARIGFSGRADDKDTMGMDRDRPWGDRA